MIKNILKKLNIFALTLSLCCTSFIPNAVYANTIDEASKNFDYSFTQEKEWKKLPREQRLESCQIPESVVDSMDTEELLESVLDYPFMIDMLAFNTYEEGYEKVKNEFPALQELINRDDFSTALLNECYNVTSSKSRSVNNDIVKSGYLTILANQDDVENNIESDKLNEIDQLLKENKNNKDLYSSLQSEKSSRASGPTTPKGSSVSAINNSSISDFTSAEKTAYNNQVKAAYNVTVIADPTKKYNCHSYAWYSQSTSNYYWINNPSIYMSDGSYKKTTSTVKSGDKVYWIDGSHSGILSYVGSSGIGNIKVKSKWGQLGLYDHYLDDCPYSGSVSTWNR